eukprot:6678127-Pyramimonas_sp.AAC.1
MAWGTWGGRATRRSISFNSSMNLALPSVGSLRISDAANPPTPRPPSGCRRRAWSNVPRVQLGRPGAANARCLAR